MSSEFERPIQAYAALYNPIQRNAALYSLIQPLGPNSFPFIHPRPPSFSFIHHRLASVTIVKARSLTIVEFCRSLLLDLPGRFSEPRSLYSSSVMSRLFY